MVAKGYKWSQEDYIFFIKYSPSERVHVNDKITTTNDEKEMDYMNKYLSNEFNIKMLERLIIKSR